MNKKKVVLVLEEANYRDLKVKCAKKGVFVSSIVNELIRKWNKDG